MRFTLGESTHKGVNQRSEDVTLVHKDVPLVEFMYLVFTRMPGESYCKATRVFVVGLV